MQTLDSSNKLIGISNNTAKTTWGGIAHRNDNGAFLAVQERRASNSSGMPPGSSSVLQKKFLFAEIACSTLSLRLSALCNQCFFSPHVVLLTEFQRRISAL